jgi:hypothetical protein
MRFRSRLFMGFSSTSYPMALALYRTFYGKSQQKMLKLSHSLIPLMIKAWALFFAKNPRSSKNDQSEGHPRALFLSDQNSAPFGVNRFEFMTLLFPLDRREARLLHFPAARFFT